MKVKMLSILAGPEHSAKPGEIKDFDEAFALALIAGGYAEPMEDNPKAEEALKESIARKKAELAEIIARAAANEAGANGLPAMAATVQPISALAELPEDVAASIREKLASGEIDPLALDDEGQTDFGDFVVDNLLIIEEAQALAEQKAKADADAAAGTVSDAQRQADEEAAAKLKEKADEAEAKPDVKKTVTRKPAKP